MSDAGATLMDFRGEFITQHILQNESIKIERVVDDNEIPKWLNNNLLEDIFCKFFKNKDVKVRDLKIFHCGGKGESFASVMYRVGVYYFHQKSPENIEFKSCILKTLPENDLAREKLGSSNYNVQNKEMIFYQRIIPEFEKILSVIGEDGKAFPEVMAVCTDLNLIVLEDLSEKNYIMANRCKGLDMNHIKLSLKNLARMHAASVILFENDKNIFKAFDTGFLTRKTDAFQVFFNSSFKILTEEIEKWTDWSESSYYVEKLKALQPHFIENGRKAFDLDVNDFNCLNHGDLWTNNMLFRYDSSNNPTESIMIDYQFFFYGSAVLDLHYFLYTSVNDKIRFESMDEMIKFYYQEMNELLKRLNYDMKKFPTLQNFQIQFLKRYFYAFYSCMISFPIQICEDPDADFTVLMGLDERSMKFKSRMYSNPRFKEVAKQMLPLFDAKGVLDI